MTEDTCCWMRVALEDEALDDVSYASECGRVSTFGDMTVEETEWDFCPFCGKTLFVPDFETGELN